MLNDCIAASVSLDYNKDMIINELFGNCEDKWNANFDPKTGTGWKMLMLTHNDKLSKTDFVSQKGSNYIDWNWREDINIAYVKQLINSLPIKTIGPIKVMYFNGPVPIHTDSNFDYPLSKRMGLSISPIMNKPLEIKDKKVHSQTLFFDDSVPHGFTQHDNEYLGIRILGDFLYENFHYNYFIK